MTVACRRLKPTENQSGAARVRVLLKRVHIGTICRPSFELIETQQRRLALETRQNHSRARKARAPGRQPHPRAINAPLRRIDPGVGEREEFPGVALERVASRLLAKTGLREVPQLVVDERKQFVQRRLISTAPVDQQTRDVSGGRA